MERGLYAILKADSDITGMVGSGDNARIYPDFVPQEAKMPHISFNRLNNDPNDTKDGVSALDDIDVDIDIWHNESEKLRLLAGYVRTALDRYSGTIATINFQSIRFVNDFTGHEEDNRRKRMTQQYSVRQKL